MKATYKLVAGLTVAGFVTAALAVRPMPNKVGKEADGITSGSTASAAGLNYSTGFEPGVPDGYDTPGYINNGAGLFPTGCGGAAFPCFGHTASTTCGTGAPGPICTPSLITPTIDTANPATGTQHLRVTFDPATRTNTPGFGLGVDARFPRTADLSARAIDVNTVSIDMAIDTPNGQDFRVQPQSNSYGFLSTSALFFYTGAIYVLDDLCGASALGFVGTGVFWDTTGAYQNYSVVMDPCSNPSVVTYSYGGAPLYAGCAYAGKALEQFLVFGDNYPGSTIDVDNLVMEAGDGPCPSVCGNGLVEPPTETCEPGVVECNPGHTCTDCVCSPTCTLDAPCTLNNGANGPFYGPFDPAFGGIFVYTSPAGVDAVSVELCGSTGADQRIFYWGSCSDPGDPGSANDDCYPGYSGADPSASCYGTVTAPNYESCTCHDNPLDGDNCYLLQIRPPAGNGEIHIEVNKKNVCAGGHLGACCDTNGADTGCTDNVLSGACVGADKVWTENGKCGTVMCACIPDCTGAACGDDGCGGSCGTCDDGNGCTDDSCNASRQCDFTPNSAPCNDGNACTSNDTCAGGACAGTPVVCNDNNACNGVETCNPSTGCVPGTPLSCDDGLFCNGAESCAPASGCVGGTAPCADNETCDEAGDTCTPNSIPTVSEWGLVVLTLMLLIGAKVYFGRRQAIA